jgi:hypothetical protein
MITLELLYKVTQLAIAAGFGLRMGWDLMPSVISLWDHYMKKGKTDHDHN